DLVARSNSARSSTSSIPAASCAISATPSARENGRSPQIRRTASLTNTLAIGPTLAPSARGHADSNVELAGSDTPTSPVRLDPATGALGAVPDQDSPASIRSLT